MNLRLGLIYMATLLFFATGCKTTKPASKSFIYTFDDSLVPWTQKEFDNKAGKFSFAIISDLWGGYREGILDVAVEQLKLLRPEFILSVGDLIDGGTEDPDQMEKEWAEFNAVINRLDAPFFYVGGNHDLTNIAMREDWAKRYGRRYYHFRYKDVLFLMLDSEDYEVERMQEIFKARAIAIDIMDGRREGNVAKSAYFQMEERRTGEIGEVQSVHFEGVIEENRDVRWTFVLMHKPTWMREDDHGLQRIETALADRPYTVINGHFHNYQLTKRNQRDYITLGTTGGSQRDKSDMSFDHITWITTDDSGPTIVNFKLEGILNKDGAIPADGKDKCFQASACKE